MFLVEDQRGGATTLVFTWRDPRQDGFEGNVIEGVNLDYDTDQVHHWPDGARRPEAPVGCEPGNPKNYQVFRYTSDLLAAGYEPVAGHASVYGTWSDYLTLRHPEDLPDEEWYASLERLDDAARARRQRVMVATEPAGGNRDDVAAWVARKHLIADSGIREVWYLPHGAPADEIRLLELNDLLPGMDEADVRPVDFGLDVAGANYRLYIADVSTDQLQLIQRTPARLPTGWSLDDRRIWGRRGA